MSESEFMGQMRVGKGKRKSDCENVQDITYKEEKKIAERSVRVDTVHRACQDATYGGDWRRE